MSSSYCLLQEASAFEYRGYRLFDSRGARRRPLSRGKEVQVCIHVRVASDCVGLFLGDRRRARADDETCSAEDTV